MWDHAIFEAIEHSDVQELSFLISHQIWGKIQILKSIEIVKGFRDREIKNCIWSFLETNADISTITQEGSGDGAMISAITAGNEDIVQLLVQTKQLDVNLMTSEGWTPLLIAAYEKNLAVTKALLKDKNIDINQRNHKSCTAFILSCLVGASDVTKLLIQHEADVNIQTIETRTGLMYAVQNQHFDCIDTILDADFLEINALDSRGIGVLHLAVSIESPNVVDLLLEADDLNVNAVDEFGISPLILACQLGNAEIVELLLSVDRVDVNLSMKDGLTAIMISIINGNAEIVKMLCEESSLDIDYCDSCRGTPLILAASKGHAEIVRILLRIKSIDIDCRWLGLTALQFARRKKQMNIVQMITSYSQNIKQKNDNAYERENVGLRPMGLIGNITPRGINEPERHKKDIITDVRPKKLKLIFRKKPFGFKVIPDHIGNNCVVSAINNKELIYQGLDLGRRIHTINGGIVSDFEHDFILEILDQEPCPITITFKYLKEIPYSTNLPFSSGDVVKVMQPIATFDESEMIINPGMVLKIQKIDEDGDVYVDHESFENYCCIEKADANKLIKLVKVNNLKESDLNEYTIDFDDVRCGSACLLM